MSRWLQWQLRLQKTKAFCGVKVQNKVISSGHKSGASALCTGSMVEAQCAILPDTATILQQLDRLDLETANLFPRTIEGINLLVASCLSGALCICRREAETVDHLFLHCGFVTSLWQILSSLVDLC
ncbi:hypothetical protein L1049_011008 [Liquidambar formosana]|uniref:Reverse transcriptase zinc-binding domain-containing protein n=1 Tax=Liquidambar formosana TaxID=63359 RepID=A0AAP0WXU0_LIQFO